MGDPEKDLPLDLDSSPWRRWSPILLDVVVVLVCVHIIRSLLIAFYPYGVMVGWYRDRGEALFAQLTGLPLDLTENWPGAFAWVAMLFVMRAGSGLLGWHRLIFCAALPLLAVIWHFGFRAGSA